MIEKIKKHKVLSTFVRDQCSENTVSATIDERIKLEDYVIIKPDDYYNSLKKNIPPSVDCLIIQKCIEGGYKLTIIELKSISSMGNQAIDNLVAKFETIFSHFIPVEFKDILFYPYKSIELYFVTEIELYKHRKRDFGLKLETLINYRFQYNGKRYMIQPRMPVPVIRPCY